MNIEFGKRIGEMVVSETSSSPSSAHSSTAIPVEEVFCDAIMQHVERATRGRRKHSKNSIVLSAVKNPKDVLVYRNSI